MRVWVVDSFSFEPLQCPVGIEQVVRIVDPVPAFQQNSTGILISDLPGSPLHVGGVCDFLPAEHFRLRNIGRQHGCKRNQALLQRLYRIVGDQFCPAGCNHYGVDHDLFRLVKPQPLRNHSDKSSRGDHPDFNRVRTQVGEDAVDLLREKFGCNLKDSLYAGCVLGCQRRDRTHGKNAVHGHCLDVSLDSGASAGVAPGDCQYFFHLVFSFSDSIDFIERRGVVPPARRFFHLSNTRISALRSEKSFR